LLKADTAFLQFVHGKIDIVHREIENGERRRNVIRFWINDNVVAAAEPQGEQTVRFRNVEPEGSGVKFLFFCDVVRRKTAECLPIF
jgi:hypothetical protein